MALAGYEGITFVAMNSNFSLSEAATLSNERIYGVSRRITSGAALCPIEANTRRL